MAEGRPLYSLYAWPRSGRPLRGSPFFTRNSPDPRGFSWLVRATRSPLCEAEAPVPESTPGAFCYPARRPRCSYSKLLRCDASTREERMKLALAVGGLTLLLVACGPTDPCHTHKDQASCTADSACQWKAEKNKCKTPKEGKKKRQKSPQAEQTTTPAPEPAPSPEAPTAPEPAVTPDANNSLPSTDTQPQPTYPDGQPQ